MSRRRFRIESSVEYLGAGFAGNPGEQSVSAHWLRDSPDSDAARNRNVPGSATYREADASRSPKESSHDDKIPNVCLAERASTNPASHCRAARYFPKTSGLPSAERMRLVILKVPAFGSVFAKTASRFSSPDCAVAESGFASSASSYCSRASSQR